MPGVYWFSDDQKNVLYVGKAKNLKNRVKSYTESKRLSDRIRRMTFQAQTLRFQVLESELEALLIEAELIRSHQPYFNVLLKDDKSPLYIHITDEKFPRLKTIRKREIEQRHPQGIILGPFPSAYKVKEVLKIARQIFPWCNQAGDLPSTQTPLKPCFYYHLHLCPGACVNEISSSEYQDTIQQLVLFLKGKKKTVLTTLKKEMSEAAANKHFELAGQLRDRIALITEVTQPTYHLKPETVLPQLTFSERADALIQLNKYLHAYLKVPMGSPLKRIEGYDVSNTQGTNASVAMVTFLDGHAHPSEYRLFNIRTLTTPNDYGMMKEALQRRQNNAEWGQPDLIIIDGGKGQLRAALSVWQWSCPVMSIAKDPDRLLFAQPTIKGKRTSYSYVQLSLQPQDPVLKLIQAVRDEAHRFSKKQHSRLREKKMFT